MTEKAHEISRREVLSLGQGAIALTVPALLLPAAARAETGDQRNWRFCNKCHSMFFDGYPNKGSCPAGGGHTAQGFLFDIHFDSAKRGDGQNMQYAWRFCNKCHSMFFDGYPNNKGRCPAGGAHSAQGYMFGLYTQAQGPFSQGGWRFCNKCSVLFFDGYPSKGRCPAGGGHAAQGFMFYVNFRPAPDAPLDDHVKYFLLSSFNANRAGLTNTIASYLGQPNLIAKGFSLYNLNPRLGQPDVQILSNTQFRLILNGNYLYFRSTQPTALGKWADPAFELHWDMQVNGTVVLGPPPHVTGVASVPRLKIQPRNVVAGVAKLVHTVVNWFAKLPDGRQKMEEAINKYLSGTIIPPVNRELARIRLPSGLRQ